VSGTHSIDPGVKIGSLLAQEPSTLLLVEEDDGVRGEALGVRGANGRSRIGST
jgi:hypothetical protein